MIDKERILITLIILLAISLCASVVYYKVLPDYKLNIQGEANLNLITIQARDRLIFFPALTQDNQTIIQSTTWQELCQNLGGS